jgi:hypothetical protein
MKEYYLNKEKGILIAIVDGKFIEFERIMTIVDEEVKPLKEKKVRKVRGPGKPKSNDIVPPTDRDEIIKAYKDGEEVDAIAHRLGVQVRTIGMIIAHARKRGEIDPDME